MICYVDGQTYASFQENEKPSISYCLIRLYGNFYFHFHFKSLGNGIYTGDVITTVATATAQDKHLAGRSRRG